MKQSKRVKYFIVGGILGILCVYLIFGSARGWMPNDKVLERLEWTFQPTKNGNCYLECFTFGQAELDNLYMDGDVDFETKIISDEDNYEAIYEIVGPNRSGKLVRITFDMYKEFAHIKTARWEDGQAADCGCS